MDLGKNVFFEIIQKKISIISFVLKNNEVHMN